jgi:4-hydroxyphenylpyruvate dioxygenase
MSEYANETLNPTGLDGFDFIEYASPHPEVLAKQLEMLGMTAVAKHKTKNITLYRQGDINYLLNAEPHSHAMGFATEHGPGASAMGFRVKDANHAFEHALSKGAKAFEGEVFYGNDAPVPTIYGIGEGLVYFIEDFGDKTIYDDFNWIKPKDARYEGLGLYLIDHLTHNLDIGRMDYWAYEYYEKIFNFRQIRFFDIKGQHTGLISRALRSPCNKITIPLNEATDAKSQIQEFITQFNGEGIQHIAMACDDIFETVRKLRENGIQFMPPPPATYYDEIIPERLPHHGQDIERLRALHILMDGSIDDGKPLLLLQIFTETMLGPVFFEIIQRKGDQGFGEGNFTALFESIERDQMNRGVL